MIAALVVAAQLAAAQGDVDQLEALGRERPVGAFTDDAWADAARLAERRGELARARADYAQVVATTDDPIVRRRAEADLARLGNATWDDANRERDVLVAQILGGDGDPKPAMAALATLIAKHPGWPGATNARLVIARGWERDGDLSAGIAAIDDAIARAASADDRDRARYAAFHARVHARDVDGARAVLAALPQTDVNLIAQLEDELATATLRKRLRIAVWIALAIAVLVGTWRARRDATSWRALGAALARPPAEVLYVGPILIALAAIASFGNPMVARAVRAIAIAGVVGAWLSGVAMRLANGRRAPIHAAVMLLCGLGVVFLVVDRDRMIDLIAETWRSGPALQ